jgi:hypothetical protein
VDGSLPPETSTSWFIRVTDLRQVCLLDAGRVRLLRFVVGDTGLEPVTSSVSRKRANQTAPIAPVFSCEVETGFEPVYTALQAVASPLGHSTEQTS